MTAGEKFEKYWNEKRRLRARLHFFNADFIADLTTHLDRYCPEKVAEIPGGRIAPLLAFDTGILKLCDAEADSLLWRCRAARRRWPYMPGGFWRGRDGIAFKVQKEAFSVSTVTDPGPEKRAIAGEELFAAAPIVVPVFPWSKSKDLKNAVSNARAQLQESGLHQPFKDGTLADISRITRQMDTAVLYAQSDNWAQAICKLAKKYPQDNQLTAATRAVKAGYRGPSRNLTADLDERDIQAYDNVQKTLPGAVSSLKDKASKLGPWTKLAAEHE